MRRPESTAERLTRTAEDRATAATARIQAERAAELSASANSAWDASGQGRRALAWRPTSAHINALLGEVETLTHRSRDTARRNPWASAVLDTHVANAVGTGITPQPLTEDDDWRRDLMDAWDEWTEEVDPDGACDFYGMQSLVARARAESGCCFARFRPRRAEDGLSVPLQIQLLESDFVDASMTEVRGSNLVKGGIEYDPVGRRVAYHMFREHPGEMTGFSSRERVRVPADQVIHVFRPLRPGQVRGVPELAPVLARIYELDQVSDARVVKEKVQALFAMFIVRPDGPQNPLGAGSAGKAPDGVPLATLEPGTTQEIPLGWDVKFSQPPQDGASYEAFFRNELRAIAAGAGATYEQMTGDLTGVNFSSIRAGLIEFRRRMEQIQQHVLIFQFCRRVWARWFETAVLAGRINLPAGFAAAPRAFMRAKWVPPGWEYVDPEKEVRALVRAIRAGLISRSEAIAQYGYDAADIDREIAADNARADRLGLVLDSDARTDQNADARTAALNDPGSDGEDSDESEDEDDEQAA